MSKKDGRNEYLENHWERYPVSTSSSRGRMVEINDEVIVLESKGSQSRYEMTSLRNLAQDFSALECLRIGDIVEIQDDQIKLLVPTYGENPFSIDFKIERALAWNEYINLIRNFFIKKNFIELRTPTLVPSPGLEPFLDPFKTQFKYNRACRDLYLPTSPEFHLKKALTLGFEKIFEFKECFRNGELAPTHNPEFLMLEWYRAYEKTENIIEDVIQLFEKVQETFASDKPTEKVLVFKMEDLWKDTLNFTLKSDSTIEDLKPLARTLKVGESEKDFDDLFNLIFLEKIEPEIKKLGAPVIIWHYPPSQAALARLTHDGWADRFEVYWRGLEIANAFHELNNFAEQKARFEIDQQKKEKLGKEIVPIDEEFIDALKWGMPPSTGIALGVERLFMALFNLKEISQCRLFSLK